MVCPCPHPNEWGRRAHTSPVATPAPDRYQHLQTSMMVQSENFDDFEVAVSTECTIRFPAHRPTQVHPAEDLPTDRAA